MGSVLSSGWECNEWVDGVHTASRSLFIMGSYVSRMGQDLELSTEEKSSHCGMLVHEGHKPGLWDHVMG